MASIDFQPISIEIINIFAKYKVPIRYMDAVFEYTKDAVKNQIVQSCSTPTQEETLR